MANSSVTANQSVRTIEVGANKEFLTIQEAINAASDGDSIVVYAGDYAENILINKAVTLLAADGPAATIIRGSASGANNATVAVADGTNDVTIGAVGKGFTIVGFDGASPGIETASVYLLGVADGFQLLGNVVTAVGEAALLSNWEVAVTNAKIDGNTFNGQTFVGVPNAGNQFEVANVPRQLIAFGQGDNPATNKADNIAFTNNFVSGTAGALGSNGLPVGANLVSIDAKNSNISGNTFDGMTIAGRFELRARGANTDIENNTIDHSVNGGTGSGFSINSQDMPGKYANNVLVGSGANEALDGTPGDDSFTGGGGDDTFVGGAGNDTLVGGDGKDSAVYAGSRADFTIGVETTKGMVTGFTSVKDNNSTGGDEGRDTLSSIETLIFGSGPSQQRISLDDKVQVFDASGNLYATAQTVQAALDAAPAGATVRVSAGDYAENILINKAVTLLAADGPASTIIRGSASGDNNATVAVADGTNDVTIGASGQGFTIVGFDGPSAAIEAASVYLLGAADKFQLVGNVVTAAGEAALLSNWNAAVTNAKIEGNTFDGQTFVGVPNAGKQFEVANVPRQLIALGQGDNPATNKADNIAFTNNIVSGTAGATGSNGQPVGNNLVSIDAKNSDISGNTFDGVTIPARFELRTRGPNTDVENNTIDHSVKGGAGSGFSIDTKGTPGSYVGNVLIGSGANDALVGTPGNDRFEGGAGTDALVGGAGLDTATYGDGATIGRDTAGHWTVTADGSTDTLSGIERVTIGSKTYLLVDNVGTTDGFATVGAALAAASGGETILIAPGTYVEDGHGNDINRAGIQVDAANITLQGVKADGSYVTSSADVAATLLSNFGAGDADTFRINPTATGFTLNGLGIDEPSTLTSQNNGNDTKALISFRADNVTITNSVFATGKASYAIEINGNAVTKYTIEGNQIGAPIWLLGGAGNGGGDEIVRGNTFFGVGSDGVQSGIYVMGGKVAGYAPDTPSIPGTITDNVFADGLPAPLFVRSNNATDTDGIVTLAQVEDFVKNNFKTTDTYAYAIDDVTGRLVLAPTSQANVNSDAIVATSLQTLVDYDTTGVTLRSGSTAIKRDFITTGDTIVLQTNGTTNVTISEDNLKIKASLASTDLNLSLGNNAANGAKGVDVTLLDVTSGQGANVDVTGNSADNTILGNSGDNRLSGGDGSDHLEGGAGNDTLNGGAGADELLGGTGNDILTGDAGNDRLDGGDGDDALNGGTGSDTFIMSAGADTANGGDGTDTLILKGRASDYTIVINNASAGNYTVTRKADGAVTTTTSVEKLQFQAAGPDAVNDTITVDTGAARSLNVLSNDTPAGTLEIVSADLRTGFQGTVAVAADGKSITYDLTGKYASVGAGETAAVATIDYLVTDASGATDAAVATVTVKGIDDQVGAVTDTNAATNTVAENAANGTLVGLVANAIDVDTNDVVTYSLASPSTEFAINAQTGVVTVAGPIDAEAGLSRTITVVATSTNTLGGATTSRADFTIAVTDVNEFSISAVTDVDGPTGGAILENTLGAVGITAKATDRDITENGVTYSLVDGTGNPVTGGKFAVDATTGVVSVVAALDRESDGASVDVRVKATSADGTSSIGTFNVAVGDDDESPVTAPTDSDATPNSVLENAAAGTTVGITALATDPDATNNTITYSLSDDDGGRFTIDAVTGVVKTTNVTIDREAGPTRSITVAAASADGTSKTSTFVINVGDVDEFDVTPITDKNTADNRVDVGATVGTSVGITAFASDGDATENTVTYSLIGGTGEFTIDSRTGDVTVASAINSSGGSGRVIKVQATSSDQSFQVRDFAVEVTGAGTVKTGTAGADVLEGTAQNDTIYGLAGNDRLNGLAGNDTLYGEDGNDRLFGDAGNDKLYGGLGDDVLTGGDGVDQLFGGDGKDTLDGGTGADTLVGGAGSDTYIVDDAGDVVDEVTGQSRDDGAVDTVKSSIEYTLTQNVEKLTQTGAGNIAGTGNELGNTIVGNDGANLLKGLAGIDNLSGGGGNDILNGGADGDTLSGGDGNDILVGGEGKDVLTGGAGSDVFVFGLGNGVADVVKDFTFVAGNAAQSDKIGVVASEFSLSIGNGIDADGGLSSDWFVSGAGQVATANHGQFVYNTTTKTLSWDANGKAANGVTVLATFSTVTTLTDDSFKVYTSNELWA